MRKLFGDLGSVIWVNKNINLKVVQTLAGHADIKTTMRYVHLLANDIEKVSENFVIC